MKLKLVMPNFVGLLSVALMALGMRLPWWGLNIGWTGWSYVFPYIIRGPATELIGYRRTAQMPLLTGLLIAAIALAFLGSWISRWKGKAALALAGTVACLGVWRFLARATSIAQRFRVPLEGRGTASYGGLSPMQVTTKLQPGMYLMAAGAALCLVAALLHEHLRPRSQP